MRRQILSVSLRGAIATLGSSPRAGVAIPLIGALFRRLPRMPSGLTRESLSLLAMTTGGNDNLKRAATPAVIMRTAAEAWLLSCIFLTVAMERTMSGTDQAPG